MADNPEPIDQQPMIVEEDVPHLYFNGFATGLSNADVAIYLQCNGRNVGVLNMSYTTTKTLSIALGTLITQLEQATKRTMLTSTEVAEAMKVVMSPAGTVQ